MNTQISTKLAALTIALVMNSALIGGVAFLFNGQVRPAFTLIALTSVSTNQESDARA